MIFGKQLFGNDIKKAKKKKYQKSEFFTTTVIKAVYFEENIFGFFLKW